jgi:hypothetical protein
LTPRACFAKSGKWWVNGHDEAVIEAVKKLAAGPKPVPVKKKKAKPTKKKSTK